MHKVKQESAGVLSNGGMQVADDHGVVTTLWREHGAYHVRVYDHRGAGRLFWTTAETLGEARRHFRQARRVYGRAF